MTPEFMSQRFGNALVGTAKVNGVTVSAYDEGKIIDTLRKDGMSGREAREFFEFEFKPEFARLHAPVYLNKFPKQKVDN